MARVAAHHNKLLTQWRYTWMSKFRVNYFELLLVLSGLQKSEFLSQLFSSSQAAIWSKLKFWIIFCALIVLYLNKILNVLQFLAWNLLIYIYIFTVLGVYCDAPQPWTLYYLDTFTVHTSTYQHCVNSDASYTIGSETFDQFALDLF